MISYSPIYLVTNERIPSFFNSYLYYIMCRHHEFFPTHLFWLFPDRAYFEYHCSELRSPNTFEIKFMAWIPMSRIDSLKAIFIIVLFCFVWEVTPGILKVYFCIWDQCSLLEGPEGSYTVLGIEGSCMQEKHPVILTQLSIF